MERPIITLTTLLVVGLLTLAYAIIFLDPEKPLNIWIFIGLTQTILTDLITLLICFFKKRFGALGTPAPKAELRRTIKLSFVASLLPTFYLSLKALGALNPINIFLSLLLVMMSFIYALNLRN